MNEADLLMLKGAEVVSLLHGREQEIVRAVRLAYEAHARGDDSLPHSIFLRFPDEQRNRIIALPAYLGSDFQVAGVKWVASFPQNSQQGHDRASAVIILNSPTTGRPQAILEGSVISAKRTAASAALAAQVLLPRAGSSSLSLIGGGLINFETVRFLRAVLPALESLTVFDTSSENARRFAAKCRESFSDLRIELADDLDGALNGASLVSISTTAINPHIADLSRCANEAVILHISLRDLTPEVILACDNVVDDIDHVCRAQTSVHLAEQLTSNRDFINCTLADLLNGQAPTRLDGKRPTIFSPFGLGILDLAVSKLVCDLAIATGQGLTIESFLPDVWTQRL
jgi:ornithine cyclodeaminase